MHRPNVLLVLADQWRGQDQGWIGNTSVQTPHLDQLAESGVGVAGARANAPVCGPSRASLLTGLLPHAHGVVANDLPLDPAVPTLGEAVAAAGYRAGWIGKWHLAGLPRDQWVPPRKRKGFDSWASDNCSHGHNDGHYYIGNRGPIRRAYRGYEPVAQTDLAIEFIREHRQTPFFLVVSVGPPHDPYDSVPQSYRNRYDPAGLPVRRNAEDTAQQRTVQQLYWSAITAVDDQIGRLVTELEQSGLRENTIMVVVSDHGDMLGSHGYRAKQLPYSESVHVPLVVSWPEGLPRGVRPGGMFGLVDLPPTLLGLIEAPSLRPSYGLDLSDGLRHGRRLRSDVLLGNWVSFDNGYAQGVPVWRGFTSETMTYARRSDPSSPWLLFDDLDDPWQEHNLVGRPDATAAVQAAEEHLDRLLSEAGDPFLSEESLIRSLDLVEAWNDREIALHGRQGRILKPSSSSSQSPIRN